MEDKINKCSIFDNFTNITRNGYCVRLDEAVECKCKPFTMPRYHQIAGFIGMGIRYATLWVQKYREGKTLFIDNFNLLSWKPMYGAPIGAIGTGTIGRGRGGEFCRFQMVPGMYQHHVVFADQFIVTIRRDGETVYQKVLCCNKPGSSSLSAWDWNFSRRNTWYKALYPRAWYIFTIPEHQVRLVCRQISPVIPNNYKDSSFPGAVFVWEIYNDCFDQQEISITFTFRNGQGSKVEEEASTSSFTDCTADCDQESNSASVSGVCIKQTFRDMPCTYAVGAKSNENAVISYTTVFNPDSSGKGLWNGLKKEGCLDCNDGGMTGTSVGCGVCIKQVVQGHSKGQCEFGLVWSMPQITFGSKKQHYTRWCVQHFGTECPALLSYALASYQTWETEIEAWQQPILSCRSLPSWYKSALFNELYYIADGGTVWVEEPDKSAHRHLLQYGRFAYLEGHEYRMYNTYDVHFYASFALLMLWPQLQLSLQYDIGSHISREQPDRVKYCMTGEKAAVKATNCVPHDIGDPDDAPWESLNAYRIHPTQEWKDLNTKFVLQVYRDFTVTQNQTYLIDMYPEAKIVMEQSLRWDTDNDGVIDNSGFPDQTYDAWSVKGASAYCGGLWLAALYTFAQMSQILGFTEEFEKYSQMLEKAKASFEEKLWNGSYYNYDSSNSRHSNSVMADQLAGHWFLKASGVPDDSVLPKEHVNLALSSVYKHNVLPFDKGQMGAINGMKPDGKKDTTSVQSEEFWCGVGYGLAATMMQEGLLEEGWQTAYGVYHTCWERYGLAFQTPEAYLDDGRFRSLGYMRPLAVWAIQHALQKYHPELLQDLEQNN